MKCLSYLPVLFILLSPVRASGEEVLWPPKELTPFEGEGVEDKYTVACTSVEGGLYPHNDKESRFHLILERYRNQWGDNKLTIMIDYKAMLEKDDGGSNQVNFESSFEVDTAVKDIDIKKDNIIVRFRPLNEFATDLLIKGKSFIPGYQLEIYYNLKNGKGILAEIVIPELSENFSSESSAAFFPVLNDKALDRMGSYENSRLKCGAKQISKIDGRDT